MGSLRDVAVVGAGPAGLHVAYRLAAARLDVLLLEAQPRIGEGAICSGVIGEEAFGLFGLPTRSVEAHIRCIQAISPAGRVLEHRSETPLARVVNKPEFNRALEGRTRAAGAEIWLDQRVESVESEKHCVALQVRASGGVKAVLKARLAVIASGVNCSLSRTLGLARPRQLLRAMQGEITLTGEDATAPTRVYVGSAVAPGAFGWQIPLGNGRARVGLMTTQDPKPYFKVLLHRILPTIDESRMNIGQKGIAQAPVGRCTADRILAIGEAAGHVKTSTGGGIYYGLLSADFAAQVVRRAFQKGNLTSVVLSDFERYWRTGIGSELLVGFFARGLASCLPDPVIERLFELANAGHLLTRLNGNLRFDWHRKALLATLSSLMACPSRRVERSLQR